MKIASLMSNMSLDFEERKRALQRKEAESTYKKNASYSDPKKNPMLEVLENLLSGKTEKELHAADSAGKDYAQLTKEEKLERPEIKKEIEQLKQTEQEVIAHEQAHKSAGAGVTGAISYTHTTGPDDQRYITGGEVSIDTKKGDKPDEMIAILEKVKQAALAPAQPSSQDLRVAATATAQIQQARGEKITEELEEAPFANEDLQVNVPERFEATTIRDPHAQTVFGKELESLLFKRTFNKATEKYGAHIAMVKNNYRSFDEAVFSKTA
ncbi:MAG: putative metalloprotease CJM1_0395 family protein [Solibacillus sp.]